MPFNALQGDWRLAITKIASGTDSSLLRGALTMVREHEHFK
ncbi:MAG: hypothetical protein ACTHJK_10790 [Sphingomicrobium sp.]|jgi:hypothetical protein